jgi:hypothetical protein
MLIYFYDIGGIIHFEFVPEGTTLSQTSYVEVVKRLIDTMRRKQIELWRAHSFLHHDNAAAHSSLRVSQSL